MSTVIASIDLSLYGCPMHYIKAKEALHNMVLEHQILLVINKGKAVDEVVASLRHQGQRCEIMSEQTLTATIKVTKLV